MRKLVFRQAAKGTIVSRWSRRVLTSVALALVLPGTSEALTITFTGLATASQGLVAHNRDPSELIFDGVGGSLITHPREADISGVYRQLTTIDSFDTTTGLETPALTTLPAGADAPAGHGLSTVGLTATDDNPILLSASGFLVDITSSADYNYNLATGIESRIYRGGTLLFFEDDGLPAQILSYSNAIATMEIDWTLHNTGIPNIEVDIQLPIGPLHVTSIDAIQVDGNTPEGPYGVFDILGAELTLLPEPSSGLLLALGLAGLGVRRPRPRIGHIGRVSRARPSMDVMASPAGSPVAGLAELALGSRGVLAAGGQSSSPRGRIASALQ